MTEHHVPLVDSFNQSSSKDWSAVLQAPTRFVSSPNSKVSRRLNDADIGRIEPLKSGSKSVLTETAEAHSIHFQKDDDLELEFLLHCNLVIFLPDGIFGEVEWSNDARIQKTPYLSPGVIIFNPSREYLRLRVRKAKYQFQILLLVIEPALLNHFQDRCKGASSLEFQQQIGLEDKDVSQTLLRIHEELKTPGSYAASYVHALIMLVLAGLMRGLSNGETGRQSTCAKGGLPNWRLKRALELMESSLSEAPTLADLARPLKLHPTSFCRAFKQSTGITPHRYLLLHRVNRAKEMMKDFSFTLTQIALDCGFNSSSQFSVVFKRIEGTSPRSFRRSISCGE